MSPGDLSRLPQVEQSLGLLHLDDRHGVDFIQIEIPFLSECPEEKWGKCPIVKGKLPPESGPRSMRR